MSRGRSGESSWAITKCVTKSPPPRSTSFGFGIRAKTANQRSHYGLNVNALTPGVLSGAAISANSQSMGRVSRGSMISSGMKTSALRSGERMH